MKGFIALLSFILLVTLAGCSNDNNPLKSKDNYTKAKIYLIDKDSIKTIVKEIEFYDKSFSFPPENYYYYGKNLVALPYLSSPFFEYYTFFYGYLGLFKKYSHYEPDTFPYYTEFTFNSLGLLTKFEKLRNDSTVSWSIEDFYNSNNKLIREIVISSANEIEWEYVYSYGDNGYVNNLKVYQFDNLFEDYYVEHNKEGFLIKSTLNHYPYFADTVYTTIFQYSYNSEGKITKLERCSDGLNTINEFQYDSNAKLSLELYSLNSSVPEKHYFIYNDKGLWVEQINCYNNNDIINRYIIEYE